MADPIRRLITVLFDKASAQKVEGELVRSLETAGKKGGDNFIRELRLAFAKRTAHLKEQLAEGIIDQREFRRQSEIAAKAFNDGLLKNIQAARREGKLADGEYIKLARNFKKVGDDGASAWDRIKGKIAAAGTALLAYFGARQLAAFGKASIQAATEAEAVWAQLGITLEGVGLNFADVRTEIEAAAAAMEDSTTMSDEEFARTLQNLTLVSGNYAESLKNVALVADLAAAKGIDFAQASEIVGKAMAGNTLALTRMFPALKGSSDVLGELTLMLEGQAETMRGTFAGGLKAVANAWDNFKEAIGNALIEAGGGASVLETLVATIKSLTGWIDANREGIQAWVGGSLRVAITTLRILWEVVSGVVNVFKGGLELAVGLLSLSFGGLAKGVALAIRGVSAFNDLIGRDNAAEKWADYADSIDLVADALIRAADASAGRGFASIGRAMGVGRAAAQPRGPSAPGGGPAGVGGGSGGGGPLALPGISNIAEAGAQWLRGNVTGGTGPEQGPGTGGLDLNKVIVPPGKGVSEWEGAMVALINSGDSVTEHLENSFDSLFKAIGVGFSDSEKGFHSWGDAAIGIGAATAAGLADGLGDYARAHGALKIAESIWPINPLGLASGAAMIAGASALDAVAGKASHAGMRSAVPSPSIPRETGRRAADSASVPSSDVTVYINPNNPTDPVFQRISKQAVDFATERYAGRKITVKPYPVGAKP